LHAITPPAPPSPSTGWSSRGLSVRRGAQASPPKPSGLCGLLAAGQAVSQSFRGYRPGAGAHPTAGAAPAPGAGPLPRSLDAGRPLARQPGGRPPRRKGLGERGRGMQDVPRRRARPSQALERRPGHQHWLSWREKPSASPAAPAARRHTGGR